MKGKLSISIVSIMISFTFLISFLQYVNDFSLLLVPKERISQLERIYGR